jgi:hypothetical protein
MNWTTLLPKFQQLHNLQFSGNIGCDTASRLAGTGESEIRIYAFIKKGLKNEKHPTNK